ncbi:hypothetical protein SpCBS45565_g05248 [Spizellomyces sp. 'palustris']|nr:hypothetical protein SpCBS45565_g05248 [Spizellomyces sp. 'palustris']
MSYGSYGYADYGERQGLGGMVGHMQPSHDPGQVGLYPPQGEKQQQQKTTSMKKHERLQQAAGVLEEQMQRDRYPDLYELLDRRRDDLSKDAEKKDTGSLKFLRSANFVPLPNHILAHYDTVLCKTFMGFFPEINRVWVTMDTRLYLWNYNDSGSEAINVFGEQVQVISSVGIVKALPGIFLEQIEYILVVTTRVQIFLLGLAFARKGDPSSPMTIYNTDLTLSADGLTMTDIVGTDQGRIFMRGGDGHLYELQYQAKEGWFTPKMRMVNHTATALSLFAPTFLNFANEGDVERVALDRSRRILYTISKRNDIEMIYLGRDGKGFHRVKVLRDVVASALGAAASEDGVILQGLYPVTLAESRRIQLVALTSSGDRLYFSVYGRQSTGDITISSEGEREPFTLELVHILETNKKFMMSENAIHEGLYTNGLLIMADAVSQDMDRTYGIEPHAGAIAQTPSKLWIDSISYEDQQGKVWQITEIPKPVARPVSRITRKDDTGTVLNELASQLESPARSFRLLTNEGIGHMTKLRPIDQLCELIYRAGGDGTADYQQFFNIYSPAEACAMCLAIACGHPSADQAIRDYAPNGQHQVVLIASRLFDEFGGQPFINRPDALTSNSMDTNGALGHAVPAPEIKYSGRHNGLALYLSRLLKPIWAQRVVVEVSRNVVSNVDSHALVSLQMNLMSLNDFLGQRSNLTAPPIPENRPEAVDSEAWKTEQESLHNLYELLQITRETIALLLIVFEQNLTLIKDMPVQQRQALENMTYQGLITTSSGLEVTRALMAAHIDKHISDEKDVQTITDELQAACPSICFQNDVILYKGIECIQMAKTRPNREQQGRKLREALELFKQIVKDVPFRKLQEITEQFEGLFYYEGVVEIVLRWAAAQDAVEYGDRGGMDEDELVVRGLESGMVARRGAYEIILNAISKLDGMLQQPVGYGGPHPDHILHVINGMIGQALAYDDQLFHETLYEWFISQNRQEQLLQIRTRYLEEFLTRGANTNLAKATLLAKYYVKHERFYEAAKTYRGLAEAPGLQLDARMQFLSLALVQSKLCFQGEYRDHMDKGEVEDIQDLNAVANVQKEILDTLSRDSMGLSPELMRELNERLLTVSELFNKYVRPCKLYEIQLYILHVSDVDANARGYAQTAWNEIIKRTKHDAMASNRNVFAALEEKVWGIGSRFFPDENVFPLQFLIHRLEEESFTASEQGRGPERGWVIRLFSSIKVSYAELFQHFNDMYETQLVPWTSTAARIYLLEDIAYLVNEWMRWRGPEGVPRRVLDDAIQKYVMAVHDVGEAQEVVGRLQVLAVRIRQ